MLEGLMQHDFPLTLHHMLGRMRHQRAQSGGRDLRRRGHTARDATSEIAQRVDRLCTGLAELGVEPGRPGRDVRLEQQRHFELYLAVPCMGAVLHTLNIRLFPEQLTYIVNHAKDRVVFVDDSLVAAARALAPTFETVEHYVVIGDGDAARCRTRSATRS